MDTTIGSVELWASSKIVGRECSTVNKDYLVCKKFEGPNPGPCLGKAKKTMNCTSDMYVKHFIIFFGLIADEAVVFPPVLYFIFMIVSAR